MKKTGNIIMDRSFDFSIHIIGLYKFLVKEHKDYVISRQVLRSGTAIGALVREAEQAQSRADFIHKLSIALKEANETKYWLDLLFDTGYLSADKHQKLEGQSRNLLRILTAIINTTKKNKLK